MLELLFVVRVRCHEQLIRWHRLPAAQELVLLLMLNGRLDSAWGICTWQGGSTQCLSTQSPLFDWCPRLIKGIPLHILEGVPGSSRTLVLLDRVLAASLVRPTSLC